MKRLKSTILGLVLLLVGACGGNKLTPKDEADLSTFAAEIALCNTQPDAGACKASVKASFDAARAAQYADAGGYVAPDGGAL